MDNQHTKQEIIADSLLASRLQFVLSKCDSKIPDSLGDRMFRTSLAIAMSYATTKPTETRKDLLTKAQALLDEYDSLKKVKTKA